jgi:hypothetical protein
MNPKWREHFKEKVLTAVDRWRVAEAEAQAFMQVYGALCEDLKSLFAGTPIPYKMSPSRVYYYNAQGVQKEAELQSVTVNCRARSLTLNPMISETNLGTNCMALFSSPAKQIMRPVNGTLYFVLQPDGICRWTLRYPTGGFPGGVSEATDWKQEDLAQLAEDILLK